MIVNFDKDSKIIENEYLCVNQHAFVRIRENISAFNAESVEGRVGRMMSIQEQQDFIKRLQSEFGKDIQLDPFPKPYCENISNVKAVYLGCDPSNKHSHSLKYVFALPDGDPPAFKRMVESPAGDLAQVDLNWTNVNAQNLCQNYFKEETAKNFEI